jgi:hypothetical protein
MVFMGWLALVLVWLSITVLRDRGRTFIAGAALSGMFVLGALHLFDPDAFVARENIARHARLGAADSLDLAYLANLGGGAVPLATQAILAAPGVERTSAVVPARCAAAHHLLTRWGPSSRSQDEAERAASWRFWNHDDAMARRVVRENAAALRQAAPPTCWEKANESH